MKSSIRRNTGFTLVEVIVVIALIAIIGFYAIPTVSNYYKLNLNSTTRKLATTIKEAYNAAAITNRVHRLVYDLDNHAFWVESGPTAFLLDTPESKEKEERIQRFVTRDEEKSPPLIFKQDPTITRDKISLPSGVSFVDVVTQQSPDPISAGLTYTHLFPHGITEQTLIHLSDNAEHKTTLIITALVGRTKVVDYYVDREEAFGE